MQSLLTKTGTAEQDVKSNNMWELSPTEILQKRSLMFKRIPTDNFKIYKTKLNTTLETYNTARHPLTRYSIVNLQGRRVFFPGKMLKSRMPMPLIYSLSDANSLPKMHSISLNAYLSQTH